MTADPWRAARERKAVELEGIAREAGVRADDLADLDVRARLLAVLAERRGKRPSQVTASTETWRVVWRFMHDAETHGRNPQPAPNPPGTSRSGANVPPRQEGTP